MIQLIPIITIIFSIFITYTINPIYALICLIIVTFQLVFFLLTQGIEFLSLILLIVYIGAISILFLFIIMMFNLQDLIHNYTSKKLNPNLFILLIWYQPVIQIYYILIYRLNYYLFTNYCKIENNNYYYYTEIKNLNNTFFTLYDVNFLTCGCVLVISMLGAITLALITTPII